MGAGNAVLAHDNQFNRWVAAEGALYFQTEEDAERQMAALLDDDALIAGLRAKSTARFEVAFNWPLILGQYESMLLQEARLDGEPI